MIRCRGLVRDYRMGEHVVHALRSVDLDVATGEFLAVMGPSGSGKSTLLNVLGLLDRPDGGLYELDGEEVGRLSPTKAAAVRNRKIGFVFQSYHLLPRMTARANVEVPLVYSGVPHRERRRRAERALEQVGLADRAHHDPSRLSGGQCQRVAIARALVNDPPLLLADEPTGNLDQATSGEIVDLIERLNSDQGRTVVMITHDTAPARSAHRILTLVDGRITEEARADVP